MLPDFGDLIKCPYCGEEKILMSLISGNTFGAEFWSDGKRIAPSLPEVSPVQKCKHCGKYYLTSRQEVQTSDKYSFETGKLTYEEWKEAYFQFKEEGIDAEDMVGVKLWLVQAYNDYYHRNKNTTTPSDEEYRFIAGILINDIINYYNLEDFLLLKAEFYREANEMEKCKEVLAEFAQNGIEDDDAKFYCEIKDRAERGDNIVFRREV